MIYAASQFKNEVDVLEIRLETIGEYVDRFVLAEATTDQRGYPRELVFLQHKERFEPWLDKIEYVVVEDMPPRDGPGGDTHEADVMRERWQRDALRRGMPDLRDDDLVYVSDLDEIPTPEALEEGLANPPLRFGMDLHVYALNWRWLDRGCRIGTLGAVLHGIDILEMSVCWAVLWDQRVEGRPGVSGWHLTYQGGVEAIRSKITGMMDKHEALVMPGVDPAEVLTDEWIERSIKTGTDIFGRTYRPTEWVDLDQLPPVVQKHPERYAHMMVPRPANQDEIEAQARCTCGGIFSDDEFRTLMHFEYCALAGQPDVVVVPLDERAEPRAESV